MKETNIRNTIILKLTSQEVRLWNNPTGMAYRGKPMGNQTLVDITPIKYGLALGSSDIIGIKKVKITEAMVGQDIGVFVAIEVKTKKGSLSKEQEVFLKTIKELGGFAGVGRTPEEALEIINSTEK